MRGTEREREQEWERGGTVQASKRQCLLTMQIPYKCKQNVALLPRENEEKKRQVDRRERGRELANWSNRKTLNNETGPNGSEGSPKVNYSKVDAKDKSK